MWFFRHLYYYYYLLGMKIFENGSFCLNGDTESALSEYLRDGQLYGTTATTTTTAAAATTGATVPNRLPTSTTTYYIVFVLLNFDVRHVNAMLEKSLITS